MEPMALKILVVEDDPDIAELISIHLGDLGYDVGVATTGKDALQQLGADQHALVVLDIMLPEMDGFEVCRRIRETDRKIPILVLSARTEEVDKVLGLELGADAYMTKPFSLRELVARIKSIFRRIEVDSQPAESRQKKYRFDRVELDTERRSVTVDEKAVELTAKEFDLLVAFMQSPGKVFSRHELLEHVWGYEYEGYSHTVNSHINRLRRKIEREPTAPVLIQTVWGVGYRFGSDQ
ncbi:MAG: response regulator transcription factor [Rhodothermales bacterium]|nr:response regulator transcription factor [Rhodothermales bacterium]